MATIDIYEDATALAGAVAQKTIEALKQALEQGSAVWVLAGGTTPMAAYALLVAHYKDAIDWSKVIVLMGDERIVPLDHADSNWGSVSPYLDELGIPDENRLVPQTELGAADAAEAYEQALFQMPQLDVIWLGVGEDGHTLSLFPGHTIPQGRIVMPIFNAPKPPPQRMTLTGAALMRAKIAFIIAAGKAKNAPVINALKSDTSLPVVTAAQAVEHAQGEVVWMLDSDAAGK